MNFVYIAIFVKTDAKEIMGEIAVLFSRFPRICPDLKIDVYLVLKKMILYHFQDDLNKTRAVMFDYNEFYRWGSYRMNSYEREIYAMKREIARKDYEMARIIEENDREIARLTKKINRELTRLIKEKDQEIVRLTEEINRELTRLINEKDQEIVRLTEELNRLKNNKMSS